VFIGLIGGQYAVGGMRALGLAVGQLFADASAHFEPVSRAYR